MNFTDSVVQAGESVISNDIIIKIVSTILILLIGLIIGKFAGKLIEKIMKEMDADKSFKKTTGFQKSITSITAKTVMYFIYFLTILITLEYLGLTTFVFNMIITIALVIIGISFLIGVKDFMPNFIAGYSLKRKNIFKVGDKIKVQNIQGKIKKITLTETHLITTKKDLMVIPNSYFMKNVVVKKK